MAKVHLGNPYRAPPASITAGEPLNRVMGQYGKNAPSVAGAPLVSIALGSLVPLLNTPRKGGPTAMRGLKGGIGPRVKQGGLGPGKLGGYGSSRQYDKNPLGDG
jgi:hypothetical protein